MAAGEIGRFASRQGLLVNPGIAFDSANFRQIVVDLDGLDWLKSLLAGSNTLSVKINLEIRMEREAGAQHPSQCPDRKLIVQVAKIR